MKKSKNVWKILTLIMGLITSGLLAFAVFQKNFSQPMNVTESKAKAENIHQEPLPTNNKQSIDYSTTRFEDSNRSQNSQKEANNLVPQQKNVGTKQLPRVNYNYPQTEQPKPRFTFDELKSQLQGRGISEVLNMLGRPLSVSDSGNRKNWYYRNIAYDSTTGNISNLTQINFECGKYSSNESENMALEALIRLDESQHRGEKYEPKFSKICYVDSINL